MRMGEPVKANQIGSSAKKEESKEKVSFEKLVVGDRVSHAKFGEGEVVQVIGTGEKALYKIQFSDMPRTFDPRFAKLIKL